MARKGYPAEFRRRALDLVASGKTVAAGPLPCPAFRPSGRVARGGHATPVLNGSSWRLTPTERNQRDVMTTKERPPATAASPQLT